MKYLRALFLCPRWLGILVSASSVLAQAPKAMMDRLMDVYLARYEIEMIAPNQSSHSTEIQWLQGNLELDSVVCLSFAERGARKADQPRMRFEVRLENYSDTLQAGRRLEDLHKRPPGLLPEEAKSFPLRTANRCGKIIVLFSTDVAQFQQPLFALVESLGSQLCAP